MLTLTILSARVRVYESMTAKILTTFTGPVSRYWTLSAGYGNLLRDPSVLLICIGGLRWNSQTLSSPDIRGFGTRYGRRPDERGIVDIKF